MVDFADNDVSLIIRCRTCGIDHRVMVNSAHLDDYENGELVQNAFPYLTPDERELIISRTCGKCFDQMFGEDLE